MRNPVLLMMILPPTTNFLLVNFINYSQKQSYSRIRHNILIEFIQGKDYVPVFGLMSSIHAKGFLESLIYFLFCGTLFLRVILAVPTVYSISISLLI